MWNRRSDPGTGSEINFWPVLLMVIVVMVPTIGVLWFVSVAVKNEQLASQQRLTNAYHTHLLNLRPKLDSHWQDTVNDLQQIIAQAVSNETASSSTAQRQFDAVISTGKVQSVVCFDNHRTLAYPIPPKASLTEFENPQWQEAQALEHQSGETSTAVKLYESIQHGAKDAVLRAFALQARVRCLLKLKRHAKALTLVSRIAEGIANVRDKSGRLIAANTELMIVELTPDSERRSAIHTRLNNRISNTEDALIPSQRLFLMKQLNRLFPNSVSRRALDAEDLAAQFVAAHPSPVHDSVVRLSQLPDIWQIATADMRLILLMNSETVATLSESFSRETKLPGNVTLAVTPPGQPATTEELQSISAGNMLPGWRLSLQSDATIIPPENSQRTLYLWICVLMVLFTVTLATYIAVSLRRQIRVMNLKNHLVGTVSHELKTPLSSIRLLVDTLLDAETFEPQQTREYLQLIARENSRLSRLIENFLTFSRLDRAKHSFSFSPTNPANIVNRAVEAAGDRFQEADCQFTIDITENLPQLNCDEDCIVIAVLNLLDNAWKYSIAPRQIDLRSYQEGDFICFSVSDNGRGLSKTESRRVFQKFYQVDQRLARENQGCGLGLSIVTEIVDAHGGDVSVTSATPSGSTFTIRLPCDSNERDM